MTDRLALSALASLLLATSSPAALAGDASSPAPAFLNSGRVLGGSLPFSEAVRYGDTLYLSGQIGIRPGSMELVPGGLRAEAAQAIANIQTVLEANGSTMADVIRCTVMLADMAEWPAFNEVWRSVLKPPFPARSAFGATGLALGARVEIECIARAR